MSKSWFALAFLPALAGCAATTPSAQAVTQKQCQNVEQDVTESHIKVKSECTTSAEGSSANPSKSQSRPVPQ